MKFIKRKSDGYIYPYSEILAKITDEFDVIDDNEAKEDDSSEEITDKKIKRKS